MQRRANKYSTNPDYILDADYEKSHKRYGSGLVPDILANKSVITVVGVTILVIILLSILYTIFPFGSSQYHVFPRPDYQQLIIGPEDKTSKQHKLLDWLYAHGFWVDTNAVALKWMGDNRGVGLVALRPLSQSETVFKIPKTLFWNIHNKYSSPRAVAVVTFLDKHLQIQDKLTLSSFLFMLDKRNSTSFWKPYIDSLPFPYGPLYWTDAEIEAAQFSSLKQKRSIFIDYPVSVLRDHIKVLHQHFPDLFPSDTWNSYYEDFCFSAMTLLHRAFSDNNEWVLVPYLDLINAHLYFDQDEGKYVDRNGYHNSDHGRYWSFSTQFYYEKDQEILDTYQGSSNNLHYLVQYGFLMSDSGVTNLNDYFSLRVDLPESDEDAAAARSVLANTAHQKHIYAEISAVDKYAIPETFLRAVLVFLAHDEELAALRKRSGDAEVDLTQAEKETAMQWILTSVEAQVHSWPTSLDQDERLYREKVLKGNAQLALSFRRTVKSLIQHAASQWRTAPIIPEHGRKPNALDWALATIKIERRGSGIIS